MDGTCKAVRLKSWKLESPTAIAGILSFFIGSHRPVCCIPPHLAMGREIMLFWPTAGMRARGTGLSCFHFCRFPPLEASPVHRCNPVSRFPSPVPSLPSSPARLEWTNSTARAPGIRGLLSARLVGPSLQVAATDGGRSVPSWTPRTNLGSEHTRKHPCVCWLVSSTCSAQGYHGCYCDLYMDASPSLGLKLVSPSAFLSRTVLKMFASFGTIASRFWTIW